MDAAQCFLRQSLGGIFKAGDTKVRDFYAAVPQDHDVLGLDVAVDDVEPVCDGKRLADLRADFRNFALVNGAALLDGGFQVGAPHELHDDERRVSILAPVVDVDDIGALQVQLDKKDMQIDNLFAQLGSLTNQMDKQGDRTNRVIDQIEDALEQNKRLVNLMTENYLKKK